jgi:RNA polymerase sigma-70 factor (ECF subfamily)
MSAFTLTEMDRLLALDDAERTFQMDEETFRLFYQQTARPLWSYLARIAGDRRHADDLLQETYYRFLRASATFESDEHRQRYLFRIATNLSRDFRRRADTRAVMVSVEDSEVGVDPRQDGEASPESRLDVARALTQLRPRERSLLMLAYVQGWSHAEIAQSLGLKTASLKAMLWRARRKLMTVMKGSGRRTGGAR